LPSFMHLVSPPSSRDGAAQDTATPWAISRKLCETHVDKNQSYQAAPVSIFFWE
jgi:hypothetical protein